MMEGRLPNRLEMRRFRFAFPAPLLCDCAASEAFCLGFDHVVVGGDLDRDLDHRWHLVWFHVDCVEEFVVRADVLVCPLFEGDEGLGHACRPYR